jgi:hypothetical protein
MSLGLDTEYERQRTLSAPTDDDYWGPIPPTPGSAPPHSPHNNPYRANPLSPTDTDNSILHSPSPLGTPSQYASPPSRHGLGIGPLPPPPSRPLHRTSSSNNDYGLYVAPPSKPRNGSSTGRLLADGLSTVVRVVSSRRRLLCFLLCVAILAPFYLLHDGASQRLANINQRWRPLRPHHYPSAEEQDNLDWGAGDVDKLERTHQTDVHFTVAPPIWAHPHEEHVEAGADARVHSDPQDQDSILQAKQQRNTIVFSLIMYGYNTAREGSVFLKSALMYTSAPLAFHIICDPYAEALLRRRFQLLHSPAHNVSVTFYRLTRDDMLARLAREGAIITDHSAGAPGLMKLFIHEILPPSVEHAIFVDTDAFFISDPALLWATFFDPVRFPPGTGLAIPIHPDQHASQWHDANKICSCVLLLNLAELRARNLMDSEYYRKVGRPSLGPVAFGKMFGKPGKEGYAGVKLGDQGYWWAFVNGTDGLAVPLDHSWEVTSCLVDMYGTDNLPGSNPERKGEDHDAEDVDITSEKMIHLQGTPWYGGAVTPRLLHL